MRERRVCGLHYGDLSVADAAGKPDGRRTRNEPPIFTRRSTDWRIKNADRGAGPAIGAQFVSFN
jgi:hypothetical protein